MNFRKAPLGLSAVTLMCLFLLAADVSLLRTNALLRAQMHQVTNLDPGRPMAELSGLGADGAPDFVGFGVRKRPTLVLVFSPTCSVCRAPVTLPKAGTAVNKMEVYDARIDRESDVDNHYGRCFSAPLQRPGLRRSLLHPGAPPRAESVIRDVAARPARAVAASRRAPAL
jgi:hypothetical protein